MELDDGFESETNTVARDSSTESIIGVNKIQIHLEADEFVTKHDLADSRNEIRKGVLLYYYRHDYWHILRDLDLPEGIQEVKRPPIDWIVICYAAGFLSLLLCDPGGGFEFHSPNYGGDYNISFLISVPLGFILAFVLNRYWGRRHAFRMGGVLALMASLATIHNFEYIGHIDTPCSVSIPSVAAACVLMSTSLLYIVEISENFARSRRFATWYLVIIATSSLVKILHAMVNLLVLQLAFVLLATLFLLGLSIAVPESPYWLLSKGNVRSAYYSLRILRKTVIEAARDIYQIHDVIATRANEFDRDRAELDQPPNHTRRYLGSMFYALLMMTRGLSSVFVAKNAMGFKPFDSEVAGSSLFLPLLRLILVGLVAPFSHCTRRPSILCLLCGMSLCVASSLGAIIGSRHDVASIFNSAFTLLHFLVDVPILLHISEAFPFRNREMGISLSLSCYAIFALGLGNLTLLKVELLFPYIVPLIILLPITSILAFYFLKETRGFSLEHTI